MNGLPRLALALALAVGCGADPEALDGGGDDAADAESGVDTAPDRLAAPDATAPDAAAPEATAPDVTAPSDAAIDTSAPLDAPALDAPTDAPRDAAADIVTDRPPSPAGVAPRGAVAGEITARDGSNPVATALGPERVFRVDALPGEHVQLFLRFAPGGAAVVLQLDRWDGVRPVELGRTDAGAGLRTLAAFDPSGPRTFWARVRAPGALASATLTVTRTPFADAPRCASDCDRLLQLPLPNDAAIDGYATDDATVFRYQFGRRDLLMHVRHAARQLARMGHAPVIPQDFSQWDGLTPGMDTGNLRHSSHQRGKDVDLSLYGTDGRAPWRSYCTIRSASGGRECVPGTARGFDAATNVRMFAHYFATGRVTMSFLDRELIALVVPAARAAMLPANITAMFGNGVHLQHWPNHDNHIHIRVSEGPSTGAGLVYEPFEPP